jgi:hypothetical protein
MQKFDDDRPEEERLSSTEALLLSASLCTLGAVILTMFL